MFVHHFAVAAAEDAGFLIHFRDADPITVRRYGDVLVLRQGADEIALPAASKELLIDALRFLR